MSATQLESWRELIGDPVVNKRLGVLWGKSPERAGGRVNLLLQHLFDTMAVGALVWDRFLASSFRARLDELTGANGKRLYVWLCGLHDVGKATPGFQGLVPDLGKLVWSTGLPFTHPGLVRKGWRHQLASAAVLRDVLRQTWRDSHDQIAWLWPMLAGHHGLIPALTDVNIRGPMDREDLLGDPATWQPLQELLVHIVTCAAGWPTLEAACPLAVPRRAEQLALSGFVTMADWIASDERRFQGVDCLAEVSMASAAVRAEKAWADMGLRGGWVTLSLPDAATFAVRFPDQSPRPLQRVSVDAASSMPVPGLMLIEAPTGEGKTEAALAAAEILASRFGAGGIYVAMPTQATSDAMYGRISDWLHTFEDPLPLALLHGRHLLSERLLGRDVVEGTKGSGELDDYGLPDAPPSYRAVAQDGLPEETSERPAEWFYGRYRGLLTANGVGTVDQVLLAATRTKYVALRYSGLSGKVVIFDEVHAADCYMSVFLSEALFWLGNGRVPVVLLSATLSPAQREELVGAYVEGAAFATCVTPKTPPTVNGYPNVLTAFVTDEVRYGATQSIGWRPAVQIGVSLCAEQDDGDNSRVVDVLRERLSDGGCALVIRNTVGRAQETFLRLADHYGDDVVLLHSHFTANARAQKTERLLKALGSDGTSRPKRLVVVATQVAEQSFDVDADILVTDLAPIDLVLQRAGRVHRHERPVWARPEPLRTPQVIVTGMRLDGPVPWFPKGSVVVYGRHLLLRSAALVLEAADRGGWLLPEEVPSLVAKAYGEEALGPEDWADECSLAAKEWVDEVEARRRHAERFRLTSEDERGRQTLEGLHVRGQSDEQHVRVRDGDMGEEVVVVVEVNGSYRTVDGLPLGPTGEAARDRPQDVLGASVRLPRYLVDEPEVQGLAALPGWRGDPWLGRSRALRLDPEGPTRLGKWALAYSQDRGLLIERCP
jgi:CRISPR-associated endonuclease/helicase Cas3